ncbi:type VII secretion protein EccB [Mycobacterium sp. D16R24]|uniref:type VII secretion protein EccB n=1 Tax=Mycobacterium sp. D16R24 TaxID=1855656 RepID=UPI000991CF2D|nr:type VII secretion protein EccB [Mycobacterium sp. D16R24]
MAVNRASAPQSSGHLFFLRRLGAAQLTGDASLEEDPHREQMIAFATSVVIGVVFIVIMGIASVVKPVGSVGNSLILRDLDTGSLFVRVGDTLYPVLNLTSARLIAGKPDNPEPVKSSALSKFGTGPLVGIPGAPVWPITSPRQDRSRWAVCDSLADNPLAAPKVTALAGALSPEDRSHVLPEGHAVLMRYAGSTYAVWGSVRSPIDTSDRATALAVGVDVSTAKPRAMSRALLNAIPATPPLRIPVIPNAGAPSPWPIAPGVVVGSILQVEDPSGGTEFFALTDQGVQKVTPLVASLIRGSNAFGAATAIKVSTDLLKGVPTAHVLDVDYYPQNRLSFIDPMTNGVTCLAWEKAAGEKRSTTNILVGRTLPLTDEQQKFIAPLTRDDRRGITADQVWVAQDAAALFRVTGMDPAAATKESIWWLAPNGVRYGIPLNDPAVDALGIDISAASQAPWPLVQVYAEGPLLNRTNAEVKQDTLAPGKAPVPLIPPTQAGVAPVASR